METTYHALVWGRLHFSFEKNTQSSASLMAMCLHGPKPQHQDPVGSTVLYHLILLSSMRKRKHTLLREKGMIYFWLLSLWREMNSKWRGGDWAFSWVTEGSCWPWRGWTAGRLKNQPEASLDVESQLTDDAGLMSLGLSEIHRNSYPKGMN